MNLENKKLMTLPQAVAWRQSLRTDGRKLMMTNGCFDILHVGHLYYLQQARQQADALIVAINTDASVKINKGPLRPINNQEVRAYQLGALACVDAVVLFGTQKPIPEMLALQPDLYCKAADYNINTIPQDERHALESVGTRILFMPFLQGFSSTTLMQKINAAGGV